jgi:hypothetical protein
LAREGPAEAVEGGRGSGGGDTIEAGGAHAARGRSAKIGVVYAVLGRVQAAVGGVYSTIGVHAADRVHSVGEVEADH